jgi:hypothetical protein
VQESNINDKAKRLERLLKGTQRLRTERNNGDIMIQQMEEKAVSQMTIINEVIQKYFFFMKQKR